MNVASDTSAATHGHDGLKRPLKKILTASKRTTALGAPVTHGYDADERHPTDPQANYAEGRLTPPRWDTTITYNSIDA